MHGYSNKEALLKTIETNQAHYWSRSRKKIWKKGETSGLNQTIKEIIVENLNLWLLSKEKLKKG